MRAKRNICIVKESEEIRQRINQALSAPDHVMSLSETSADAKLYGVTIEKAALSKYLKHKAPVKGGLTQEQILFLCLRHGININLMISKDKIAAKLKFDKLWQKKVPLQQT